MGRDRQKRHWHPLGRAYSNLDSKPVARVICENADAGKSAEDVTHFPAAALVRTPDSHPKIVSPPLLVIKKLARRAVEFRILGLAHLCCCTFISKITNSLIKFRALRASKRVHYSSGENASISQVSDITYVMSNSVVNFSTLSENSASSYRQILRML